MGRFLRVCRNPGLLETKLMTSRLCDYIKRRALEERELSVSV